MAAPFPHNPSAGTLHLSRLHRASQILHCVHTAILCKHLQLTHRASLRFIQHSAATHPVQLQTVFTDPRAPQLSYSTSSNGRAYPLQPFLNLPASLVPLRNQIPKPVRKKFTADGAILQLPSQPLHIRPPVYVQNSTRASFLTQTQHTNTCSHATQTSITNSVLPSRNEFNGVTTATLSSMAPLKSLLKSCLYATRQNTACTTYTQTTARTVRNARP
jgi:hypothetical protein